MPTQTFRTSESFSTALTHIARLRFKGNDDKQADGHVLSSDNVRQQPPIRRGVFGGYLKRTEIENPWNSRGFLVNFGSVPGSHKINRLPANRAELSYDMATSVQYGCSMNVAVLGRFRTPESIG
jgi:hypothetical protein